MKECRTRDNHVNEKLTAQDFGWRPEHKVLKCR